MSDGLLVKSKTSFYRHCGNWGYLGRREVENSKTFDKIEDQHSRFKIQDSRFKISIQDSRFKIEDQHSRFDNKIKGLMKIRVKWRIQVVM